jgi:hypothetical protein
MMEVVDCKSTMASSASSQENVMMLVMHVTCDCGENRLLRPGE